MPGSSVAAGGLFPGDAFAPLYRMVETKSVTTMKAVTAQLMTVKRSGLRPVEGAASFCGEASSLFGFLLSFEPRVEKRERIFSRRLFILYFGARADQASLVKFS